MSIRRTKEQKKKAQQLRTAASADIPATSEQPASKVAYTFTAVTAPAASSKGVISDTMAQYVRTDLLRTALTAGILFVALVGIYFYRRYN